MNQAILYLIYNKELSAIKIGVGDITGRRYKVHKNRGWTIIKYWYFSNKKDAHAVEAAVLKEIRKRTKSNHYLNKEHMPDGGYTETFDATKITKRKVINLINKTFKAMAK